MTRSYLLFSGEFYYPQGGWDDFKGCIPQATLGEITPLLDERDQWYHVIELNDLGDSKEVAVGQSNYGRTKWKHWP